ncbi:class II aaRS and biotin synthetases superfamily protein [Actinidia rufa]|uniref:histidine--tRNA ligase n=1 Tax=Actinidia rufa TaxID=165716 RepID=A0A7J0FQQ3_9ERIC|nr:class II aaRS and biotin synthetases superfamily protein [Actinidia rufa]
MNRAESFAPCASQSIIWEEEVVACSFERHLRAPRSSVSSTKQSLVLSFADKIHVIPGQVEEKGLTVEAADKIGTFVKERGHPLELLSKLKQEGSKFLENEGSLVALNELESLFKVLEKSKCIDKVVFDLSLARGLDYYTGVIFEAVFKGNTQVGNVGSIAAGGRYDNFIGMFGTKKVPAVGVSLGIERVFTIIGQLHKDQPNELGSEYWNARLKAECMASKRLTKHFDRATTSRIPLMVVGERELNEGLVKLKYVETSDEEINFAEVVKPLRYPNSGCFCVCF